MNIELRSIDAANRDAVELLELRDGQSRFVASNKKSLETAAKAEYREIARPFAIYGNGKLIGFTMFAFEMDSSDPMDRYWLWRFMIDKNFQGQGYGRAALEKIIDYFRSRGADHILLSTEDSNEAALSLYHSCGFAETGEMNDDETVLRMNL